jgi:chemotaxis protein methyltransferase CheR
LPANQHTVSAIATATMNAASARRRLHIPRGDSQLGFDDAAFDCVRQLIHQRAGISLHTGKRAMVYSRLSRRVRALGHDSFDTYLRLLESASGAAAELEWQEFINCLTTNLTSFFREEHHFEWLAEELLRRKGQRLRLWCCAASTGEEPYSLAMTVVETLGAQADVSILCSDIDTAVLGDAERGEYEAGARGLSLQRMHRHFLRGRGANSGLIRSNADLRRLLTYRQHNLMDRSWSLGEPFDIVFCRNVMIYFDAPTQRRVLESMHRVMQPQGLLFAGHSENFSRSRDLFRLLGKTIYQRA